MPMEIKARELVAAGWSRSRGSGCLGARPLADKDATKVKAQIARFNLATVVGEILPQGCIMAGETPEPHWMRARREKKARHKAERRAGEADTSRDTEPT